MEIAGIDDLIRYVDDLSLKCGWQRGDRDSALSGLRQIRDRMTDPRLYLGVVGEFSSGKSTFINALLGVELLKEDVLQGTTCAPTFIGAGDVFDVEVVFKDGSTIRYSSTIKRSLRIMRKVLRCLGYKPPWLKDVLAARDFIIRYTADEEHSCRVDRVALTLPIKMPFFTENVVLVDTPGVNAENGRHQDVTELAMQRYCDLVVTLTVAPTPCPQSLTAFLIQNEASVKDRCIGLITQIDRVRKTERNRQVDYIRNRFKSEGIDLLGLHAAAPYYVVHPEEANTEDKIACRDQFPEIATKILAQLVENKDAMIAKKTRELLESVINDLVIPVVKNAEATAGQKIEQYESARLRTYEDFRNDWLKVCAERFSGVRMQEERIARIARSLSGHFAEDLRAKLKSATSGFDVVRTYANGFASNSIKSRIASLVQDELGKWSAELLQLRDHCLSEISDAFSSYGIVAEGCLDKTGHDKKRPVVTVPCGAATCARVFSFKYWVCMIASGIGLILLALVVVVAAIACENWWILLALLVVWGLGAAAVDVDRWRANAQSSLLVAQERLFLGLREALSGFERKVYEFDLEVVECKVSEYGKYKREMLAKVKETARNVRQERDKASLAREALPVLNNALENIRCILAREV